MFVHVCVPFLKRSITLEGEPSEKVLSVKLGLQTEEELMSIPLENMRLTLTSNKVLVSENAFPALDTTILEDELPISEYSSSGSLFLQLRLLRPISAKTSDGQTFRLLIEESDTVEYLKKTIERLRGIPSDRQALAFVDPNAGTEFQGDFQLIPLQDGRSMFHYYVPHDYTLFVKILMHIVVKMPNGKALTIGIHPSDIIYEISRRIQDKEGILATDQLLGIEGQVQENGLTKTLVYNRTVFSCNIIEGTILLLGVAQIIQIITPEGRKWKQKVYSCDTTEDIRARIYFRFRIPPANQILLFCDEPLEPGKTLTEQNIPQRGTIVVHRSIGYGMEINSPLLMFKYASM